MSKLMDEKRGRKQRILMVEDDEAMAVGVRDGLEFEGFDVTVATDGVRALELCSTLEPDLILLDVMLPKMNGIDVCKKLRGEGNKTPIIMLTARGQEIDKILGLKMGADDYVTKPFSFMELVARIEAVLRRIQGPSPELDSYAWGDISVAFKKGELSKGGHRVEVSPRELRLLQFFIAHRGEIVSRDQLLLHVWGHETTIFTRTVDMHIAKLRKKIEDRTSDPKYIVTVHGAGYRFTG
jgi:DNA-binding response OmpR family regulator